MCIPIILFRQSFNDAVVEIFVVREDDMASYIVKLYRALAVVIWCFLESRVAHKAFRSNVR